MASTRAKETEEALGPLPKGWERGVTAQGKVYFVDHNTKLTSWIDPRTVKTRKHDIREIQEGELPYGWEEAYDSVVGIYYIDHTTKSTYLDAPWDKEVQEHAVALREHLAREQKRLEAQKKLYQDKKTRLAEATRRVTDLESEKIRLEREVEVMRTQAQKKESQLDQELEAELMAVKTRLEKEKVVEETEAKEYNKLKAEVEEFNSRLNELRNLNDRLKREEQSQLEAARNTEREIQEVSHLLEVEAAERVALESYIIQLTQEIMNAANRKAAAPAAPEPKTDVDVAEPEKTGEQVAADAKVEAESRIANEPAPEPAPRTKKTNRLDMEMELLALRKRLEGEKKEKDKLINLTHSIEAEKARLAMGNAGAIPDWIKKINIQASNSKTLRVKIANNQKQNPDNLSFREKMLFYTAGAVETNHIAPIPESVKVPDHVKGPKETQYANISRGTSGVNVLEQK